MRDLGPTLPAAGELYRQIMELLPPPPGLIRPEDADPHTVYRVEYKKMEETGWRCDQADSYPWLLSTDEWVPDDEVTIIGRADLPQGAPLVLTTVEDYERAPEGTIVLVDALPGEGAWTKTAPGEWAGTPSFMVWCDRYMGAVPSRVIRWGRGE